MHPPIVSISGRQDILYERGERGFSYFFLPPLPPLKHYIKSIIFAEPNSYSIGSNNYYYVLAKLEKKSICGQNNI